MQIVYINDFLANLINISNLKFRFSYSYVSDYHFIFPYLF